MPSKHLNVLLDQELYMALENHAKAAGMNISQATRDLLRHALAVVTSTRDAGWREGYAAAYSELQKAVLHAISQVTPVLPPELHPQVVAVPVPYMPVGEAPREERDFDERDGDRDSWRDPNY